MEKLKGALVVGSLRLFARLPWRMVQGLGSAIGWLMWKLPNRSREVARINLHKCFPELSAAVLDAMPRKTLRKTGMAFTERASAWIWPAEKN
ncbi:MAG TPA: lipid A biosynthesis lauroyl acyltransferase, partial [Pseudomonas sp.]|nr:lipid A biosynthesis lauroyl acyltransferase [Pseudomonas sp.]